MAPLIVAHRGYRDQFPENTLAAFQGALDIGVEMIETDLQVTKDGHVVINHDQATGRTYGENLVISDTDLSRLKELTNKKDPTQKIVSLDEFLQWYLAKGSPTKIMFDIKSYNDVIIIAKVIRSLLDARDDISFWHDRIVFGLWSLAFYEFGFNTGLLAHFAIVNITISPTAALSFVNKSKEINDPRFKLKGVSLLSVSLLTREFANIRTTFAENDVELYVWTSNTANFFKSACYYNAVGIVTDKPVELREFYAQIGNSTVQYEPPPFFSSANLQLTIRFAFFRLFEFIHLRNLLIYAPVRIAVGALLKLLAG